MDNSIYILFGIILLAWIIKYNNDRKKQSKSKKAKVVNIDQYKAKRNTKQKNRKAETTTIIKTEEQERDYTDSYKPKKIMTANEKNAYLKIQEAAQELGYIALTKVRLFDLVEPKQFGDKGAQWKIQAKHVDFVICDKTLSARYIIELTDSSHDAEDRIERDQFVATILRNCGYKVLFTRNIEKERLISWIREQQGIYSSNSQ